MVGTPEIVFDWSNDACARDDIPDAPARAFRDAKEQIQMLATHYTNRRFIGPDLDHMQRDCNVVLASHQDGDPAQFNDREWIVAPYTHDGQNITSLVHNEYQGHTHPGQCPSGSYQPCWYNSITTVQSNDGGVTYQHLAPPAHLAASVPFTYMADTGPYGLFNPSNILYDRRDGYHYALVRLILNAAHWPPNGLRGVCVMRSESMAPGSWMAWDGSGYNMPFIDPYQFDGNDPTPFVCSPVSYAEIQTMNSSVTYNTQLRRFLLVGIAGKWIGGELVWGVYYSLSEDMIHWSERQLLWPVETVWTWAPGDEDPIAYPSQIDPDSTSRNFETSDDRFYIYFTRFNKSTGDSMDRDLLRVEVTVGP